MVSCSFSQFQVTIRPQIGFHERPWTKHHNIMNKSALEADNCHAKRRKMRTHGKWHWNIGFDWSFRLAKKAGASAVKGTAQGT